ncbi:hypothetical protein CKM354_000152600 [Cercospora kikuchii]|uniref:Uncharacterized protein n=1 Tax=Cercospora kikuchii TaxID=84275 RepID=A0A9P3FBZ5_9PEZI|nr:uncharacterized protein CKM354_000152600 [Cercospora kikuchii]GIZ38102.1 hypothetical protein CKM354_000152600 [Cercospora kikuchii]
MKSSVSLFVLSLFSFYPVPSAWAAVSATANADSVAAQADIFNEDLISPTRSLVTRGGGRKNRKCLREFETCHSRTVMLAAKSQDLEEQRLRMGHSLDYYTGLAAQQSCGSQKNKSDAYLDEKWTRRGVDEPIANHESNRQASLTSTYSTDTAATAMTRVDASSSGTSTTTGTGRPTSTDVEFCDKELKCLVNVRDHERQIAMLQQDLDHKQARINDLLHEMAVCANKMPPAQPRNAYATSQPIQRRGLEGRDPNWDAMMASYSTWVDACKREKTDLEGVSKRVAEALARGQKVAAINYLGGTPAAPASKSSSPSVQATSSLPSDPKFRNRNGKPKPEKTRLENVWDEFERCTTALQAVQEKIKADYHAIQVVQKGMMFDETPMKRKREEPVPIPDPYANSAEAARVEAAQNEQAKDQPVIVEKRMDDLAKRGDELDMYATAFEHANQVVDMWQHRYEDAFNQLIPLYAELAEMTWGWVRHEQHKAETLLAGKTKSPSAMTVTVAATPSRVAAEDAALPITTLQTSTRGASVQSDLADSIKPATTSMPWS